MARDGLLIGEVAARTGVSRKAVRLYEASGILPSPRRTAAGYRVFEPDTEATLAFVMQARRLGFGLGEIKDIVTIKRAGRTPCAHVRQVVQRKARDLDGMLADLQALRRRLRKVLRSWPSGRRKAAVCPHIEHAFTTTRRFHNGKPEDVALPLVHRLPRSGGSRRRGANR
jgi:MerR family transcriptional regulator, copper efflux regulator